MKTEENTVYIVLGMAGTGKTTFSQRLYADLSQTHCKINKETGLNDSVFSANLDPACLATKMPLHYDIRDTIDIADVMNKNRLGPNGAILASLNMFVAQIDTFIAQIERVKPNYTVIDTPGQIEMFTTSVSGQIITECLAHMQNTKVHMLYIVDGEKAQNPECFISNMVFATSIMYKFSKPLSVVVNKSDHAQSSVIEEWMQDIDLFTKALTEDRYITPTLRSIALWTEEFYNQLQIHHVSSISGMGMKKLLHSINDTEHRAHTDSTDKHDRETRV